MLSLFYVQKLPNYFTPKWVNHSIYKGLRVVHNVRNMEREKLPNYSVIISL